MKQFLPLLLALTLLLYACSPPPHVDDSQIIIAMVDTGISTAALPQTQILPGWNYLTDTADTEDRINHGTAVASILTGCETAGVPAGADFVWLVPLVIADKVDGKITQADDDTLAQVIRDAVDVYQADIINLSLGVQNDTEALREAVAYAEAQEVLLVSAVGNGGEEGKPYYPAAYETVLAVGSCNKNGIVSHFSQPGADMLAQGEGMLLASRNGRPYGIKGTSFAAGLVTAYAAVCLHEEPVRTCEEFRNRIRETYTEEGPFLYAAGVKEK